MRRKKKDYASLEEWRELCASFDNRCVKCGAGNVELTCDHIIPVSKGGNSNLSNLQPLCRSCNSSKQNREAIDYRSSFWSRFSRDG